MGRKAKIDQSQMLLPMAEVLYDPRFLEAHAGSKILHDPKTAIVELIANAWDAGATTVQIKWPDGEGIQGFSIEDNGNGMTDAEFRNRWRKLNFDRLKELGATVRFPKDLADGRPERTAFGRNGIGRWSGFCFGREYFVDTCKDGLHNRYKVERGSDQPFLISHVVKDGKAKRVHGTTIECPNCRKVSLSADDARSEIGMRFLTDPNFAVSVNRVGVSFEHIDDPNVDSVRLDTGDGHSVELVIIDTQVTDRTMKQHGVAWHVGGRLVGSCSWKGIGSDDLVDGRRIAAKRFTFIVRADHLADANAVKKDWSGFDPDNDAFLRAAKVVYEKVRQHMLTASEEDRKHTLAKARERNKEVLETIGPLATEKWEAFVTQAQVDCPSVKECDIVKLSEVMANLESAKSGYALLHKLSEYGPDQLDDLHRLLDDWTLDMAKVVLDEIGRRVKLVDELREKTTDDDALEVQDLQPLFERGLWVFGPEFETIEYTSNEGMTRVVQDLFGQPQLRGSRNRPDFAILPDGSAGLYSIPQYDRNGGEIGVDRLVVIELKKPGVPLGSEQKAQCWKYVKELYEKGLLHNSSDVRCFVLGKSIADHEEAARTEKNGRVVIQPLVFSTILDRAKGRLLKLYDRIKGAPFLKQHQKEIAPFLRPMTADSTLFKRPGSARRRRAAPAPPRSPVAST